MKELLVQPDAFLTPQEIIETAGALATLRTTLEPKTVGLSMEARRRRRKMGARRLAYVQEAEQAARQHEQFLPRTINAIDFTTHLKQHQEVRNLRALLEALLELTDDHLMALGIDLMLYTKLVHDAIRSGNLQNPILDTVLSYLDEFNKRADAEDSETPTTESDNAPEPPTK